MISRRIRTADSSARVDVRRLALSRMVSLAGTDASALAVGYSLYAKTHSPVWLSLSLLLSVGLGTVLAPVGGWLGDRFARRRLMLAAELASAALFAVVALVPEPAILLAMALPGSLLGAIFGASSMAAIANIATEKELAWANSAIGVGSNIGKTAGRLAGGALIAALGPSAVLLVDAGTFVVSAALIASVTCDFGRGERRRDDPGDGGIGAGMRYLGGHAILAPVLAAACVSTLVTSFSMTAEIPLVAHLGGGPVALGILTACWGAGMIGGSWLSGRSLHRGNEVTGVLAGRAVMAVGIASVALMPVTGAVFACYVVGGLGGGFMGAASQSIVQRNVPDHLRGRVFGAMEAARNLAFGIGALMAGLIVSALGPVTTFGVVGIAVLVGLIPMARVVRDLGGLRSLRPAFSQ